jgi:hypothetical protein
MVCGRPPEPDRLQEQPWLSLCEVHENKVIFCDDETFRSARPAP